MGNGMGGVGNGIRNGRLFDGIGSGFVYQHNWGMKEGQRHRFSKLFLHNVVHIPNVCTNQPPLYVVKCDRAKRSAKLRVNQLSAMHSQAISIPTIAQIRRIDHLASLACGPNIVSEHVFIGPIGQTICSAKENNGTLGNAQI